MTTWGTLTWVLIVAAFVVGARWGRARQRLEQMRAEFNPPHLESCECARCLNRLYNQGHR